jgi:hypothetical protein
MANNYYDATGVLVLDRVTPVIKALFGAFKLDETYPGSGKTYIARLSETNYPQWDNVLEGLADLAATNGLDLPDRQDGSPLADLLHVLATHFDADDDEELENLIEHHSFEDEADLEALFLIATRFDDGHHLTAIQFEGCWSCSKPRLFEFGGDSCYLSREISVFGNSHNAIELGARLRQFIVSSDIEAAAVLIAGAATELLSGITDDALRTQLRQRVAERLRQAPAVSGTAD